MQLGNKQVNIVGVRVNKRPKYYNTNVKAICSEGKALYNMCKNVFQCLTTEMPMKMSH